MRALVTGGAGFIGSHLVAELHKLGHAVDVVDDLSGGSIDNLSSRLREAVPGGQLVVTSPHGHNTPSTMRVHLMVRSFDDEPVLEMIRAKKYDVIFHQAALPRVAFSVEHPAATDAVNAHAFVKLLEASIGNVKKVVFASSSSVYGGADYMPTHETTPHHPKSPYALQKSICEQYATLFGELYGLETVGLRYFNVFGPGQHAGSPYSTAVAAWCHAIKHGAPLRSDGDGSQTRDMCYVTNVVSANILAAECKPSLRGKCYNVAVGESVSNRSILDFLQNRYPAATVVDAPWRPGDVMHTLADVSRAKADLGYVPLVKFWDGLEETIRWWESLPQ